MNWTLVAEIALGLMFGTLGIILLTSGVGYLYSRHHHRRFVKEARERNDRAKAEMERRAQRVAERKAQRAAERQAKEEAERQKVEEQVPVKSRFEVLGEDDPV